MIWTDATVYSQKDKTRTPTCWTGTTSALTIEITCGHIYHPGKWMVACGNVGMQMTGMKIADNASPEAAQEMAVRIVRHRLEKMRSSLNG